MFGPIGLSDVGKVTSSVFPSVPSSSSGSSFSGFGLGSLIAGGLNYLGQHSANKANRRMAERQMQFQRESNAEQMQFQERMSNTAYQRAVQDMRSAGINPILAYSQGGSSTPGGSSSAGASMTQQNEVAPAIFSALDAKRISAQIEQTKVLTDIAKAELSGYKLDQQINESKPGIWLRLLERIMPSANSAGSLLSKFLRR